MPVVNTLVEVWLAYHCTVCPDEHTALKFTTPLPHTAPSCTLDELGAGRLGFTTPVTSRREPVEVIQFVVLSLQPT